MEIIDGRDPGPREDGWLGFDSRCGHLLAGDSNRQHGNVRPGETIIVRQMVQVPFKARRMFTWQRTASEFLIHEMRISNRSIMVAASTIPADAFATPMDQVAQMEVMLQKDKVVAIRIDQKADKMLGADLHLPVAHPGMDISFIIENVGGELSRFVAGIVGTVPFL